MEWDGTSIPNQLIPAAELTAWKTRTGPSGILSDEGPAAEWRTATILLNWRAYQLWLGWLNARGDFDAHARPEARFSADRVIAFVQDMRNRSNSAATIFIRILALERVLATLAPEFDRQFIRTIIKNLPEERDASAKRARLQETAVLVDLGIRLMRGIDETNSHVTRQRATIFRDGLMVALLALRPLRRGNFSSMELRKNLVLRGNEWRLFYDEDETKAGPVIDVPFPLELVPWLERYLSIYRPLLAGNRYGGNRVWLSYWWTAMNEASVYGQVVSRTEAAFGVGVNPHLFRHCLATSLAIDNPEIVGIAHHMLGNNAATCQRVYNLAGTQQAGKRLNGALDVMRKQFQR